MNPVVMLPPSTFKNPIQEFIHTFLKFEDGHEEKMVDVLTDYEVWCWGKGLCPVGYSEFTFVLLVNPLFSINEANGTVSGVKRSIKNV